MPAIGNGISPFFSVKDLSEVQSYISRVNSDSGEVTSSAKLRDLILFLKSQGLYSGTQMLIAPILGGKWRTSTIYKYASKLYSVTLATNDAAQTTELSQPYQSGNIAPTEMLGVKNPNGDTRFFTHPPISYAANEAWSVCILVNWNGSGEESVNLLGNYLTGVGAVLFKRSSVNRFSLRTLAGGYVDGNTNSNIIGKNKLIHLIYEQPNVNIYVDNVLHSTIDYNSGIVLTSFFRARISSEYLCGGAINYYRTQSGAMTAGQMTAETALIRSWLADIQSVQIGTQTWATSNLDVVATPLGNAIPEVQTAGAIAKTIVNPNFDTNLTGWTLADASTTYGWQWSGGKAVCSLASGNRNINQSLAGITAGRWVKLTVDIETSGVGVFIYLGSSNTPVIKTTNGSYTIYGKMTNSVLSFYSQTLNSSIDNITLTELNWSNATEIYDAVYAATSGDAATKHYAAVKEAAMWCYHGNSTSLGAIYNKIYNGYSKGLQILDLASASYGYHIATKAELQALGTSANALKAIGTNYWTTANGTNTTGKTLLGGSYRDDSTGAFGTIKETVEIWCADVDEVMRISDGSDTITFAAVPKTRGAYIVYVKD